MFMIGAHTELKPLTNRQQQIYDLIQDKISETGMPPTRAEIAKFFGFKSANAAEEHLKALAKKNEGIAYFINNTSALEDDLINDSRFATIQKSTKKVVSLIDWKLLLLSIILTLSAEWFIRKYNGLI